MRSYIIGQDFGRNDTDVYHHDNFHNSYINQAESVLKKRQLTSHRDGDYGTVRAHIKNLVKSKQLKHLKQEQQLQIENQRILRRLSSIQLRNQKSSNINLLSYQSIHNNNIVKPWLSKDQSESHDLNTNNLASPQSFKLIRNSSGQHLNSVSKNSDAAKSVAEPLQSLNSGIRAKKNHTIQIENQQFLKKLQSTESSIQLEAILQQDQEHQSLIRQISRFDQNGNRKKPPILKKLILRSQSPSGSSSKQNHSKKLLSTDSSVAVLVNDEFSSNTLKLLKVNEYQIMREQNKSDMRSASQLPSIQKGSSTLDLNLIKEHDGARPLKKRPLATTILRQQTEGDSPFAEKRKGQFISINRTQRDSNQDSELQNYVFYQSQVPLKSSSRIKMNTLNESKNIKGSSITLETVASERRKQVNLRLKSIKQQIEDNS